MFCFLPTHWHALVTVETRMLQHAVQWINQRYAHQFNARYRRRGKVFDSPYSGTLIDHADYFGNVVAYIALNPPEPESWPWSSYPALLGNREPFTFIDPAPIFSAFGNAENLKAFVDQQRLLREERAL
jgi:transglutaminase-like putative cysteine protease